MKVLIIGGGTSGTEVAWRLRQQNKEIEIVILEKGEYTQYSPCALPYLISGKIKNIENIFLFDPDYYAYNNIKLELKAEVQRIDRLEKKVYYNKDGKQKIINYDKLVIAVGGRPKIPPILGLEDCGYFTLKNIDDVKEIQKNISTEKKALIIGGGYIGLELADALSTKGLEVCLVEVQNFILPNIFDKEISEKIREYIENKGIKIFVDAKVDNINSGEAIINGKSIDYDLLFLCCGLSPDFELAQKADLKCNEGVVVDAQLRTSDKDIYACGDSVQSINLAARRKIFSQLATIAVRQARVIASNILGEKTTFNPVLNASISKFDNLVFGSCGVSQEYCIKNKIKNTYVFYTGKTKSEYYPNSLGIFIKFIVFDNGKIAGCQIAGFEDIASRINLMSLAIKQQMSLDEFILTETCYNPSVAPIFEPLVLAAEICLKKLKNKE